MRHIIALLTFATLIAACGTPRRAPVKDDNLDSDPTGINNEGGNESQSCTERADCGANEFCRFDGASAPFAAGTEGVCSSPCGGDSDCTIGQECYIGVCYTKIACSPENLGSDCPPDESCIDGTCTYATGPCTTNLDCSDGFICNADGSCIDPNNAGGGDNGGGGLGSCSIASDCNTVAGCEGGTCTCDNGSCVNLSSCVVGADGSHGCGSGFYCQSGSCTAASQCDPNASNSVCGSLNLVCADDGYCTNPVPCSNGQDCDPGFECSFFGAEGGCMPTDLQTCNQDSECPSDKYCEVFTGTCETGCRDDSSCVGQCPGSDECSCNGTNQCSAGTIDGGSCDPYAADELQTQCPAGMACALTDLLSGAGECRQKCNRITEEIFPVCPNGQSCGGGSSGSFFLDVVLGLLETILSDDGNGSFCL